MQLSMSFRDLICNEGEGSGKGCGHRHGPQLARVTRNEKDVSHFGARIIYPWKTGD